MSVSEKIHKSINKIPSIEGPIPVTEESHPFCAMTYSRVPLDVADYGFVEEEFFLSGFANVYDADKEDQIYLVEEELPYKNRILVRRPKDVNRFSGRVYVDIVNASQNYDIEDLWHRNYLWCMENGHAYVGITSKPITVVALKNFDYNRYHSLNWSNGDFIPRPTVTYPIRPTVPGTEEGLFWDMLSQLGTLLRYGGSRNCLNGWKVNYIYLTGQSQSGGYLNTYINYFDRYLKGDDGKLLFDGFMNIVGALFSRKLRQEEVLRDAIHVEPLRRRPCQTPFICISSEGDLILFPKLLSHLDIMSVKIHNSDMPNDKCRYYEIPGAPHTNIVCPVLPGLNEIKKTGAKLPSLYLYDKLLENLTDFPAEYYICGLLDKLHKWAAEGKTPEVVPLIKRNGTELARDSYGNVEGGLRSPFLDVPIASYNGFNQDDPEGISGKMYYFTKAQVEKMYGSIDQYLAKFAAMTNKQVEDKWITGTDGNKMIEWSQKAAVALK